MTLPPTFSMKAPKDTMTVGTGGGGKRKEDDDDKCDKKKGKGNGKKHTLVKKLSPHSEICMLVNETWAGNLGASNLTNTQIGTKRCKCCPHWFLQKYCFSDCPNKESHVPAKKVPPSILQKVLAWIKACHS